MEEVSKILSVYSTSYETWRWFTTALISVKMMFYNYSFFYCVLYIELMTSNPSGEPETTPVFCSGSCCSVFYVLHLYTVD